MRKLRSAKQGAMSLCIVDNIYSLAGVNLVSLRHVQRAEKRVPRVGERSAGATHGGVSLWCWLFVLILSRAREVLGEGSTLIRALVKGQDMGGVPPNQGDPLKDC
jgi:hypothetical protein